MVAIGMECNTYWRKIKEMVEGVMLESEGVMVER